VGYISFKLKSGFVTLIKETLFLSYIAFPPKIIRTASCALLFIVYSTQLERIRDFRYWEICWGVSFLLWVLDLRSLRTICTYWNWKNGRTMQSRE